jgi:hypothetical protein
VLSLLPAGCDFDQTPNEMGPNRRLAPFHLLPERAACLSRPRELLLLGFRLGVDPFLHFSKVCGQIKPPVLETSMIRTGHG